MICAMPSYTDHSLQELMTQRIYLIGCSYEDGNDANHLRTDAVFKIGVGQKLLDSDQ